MPHSRFCLGPGSVLTRILGLLFITWCTLSPAQAAASEAGAIGTVTLVIGKAYIAEDNSNRLIKQNTQIFTGDRIITRANGHVHIRFRDKGLVSVRPNSKLYIEQYEFNSESPDKSTIKLNLEKGVARSVSGTGAKAARDRFRMNTPIAAIGVRGTDFVVSASHENIRAIVNEGIIVVAPFSDQCSADSLGPCSVNAVELSENSDKLLQLNRLHQAPQLLPIRGEVAPELLNKKTTPPPAKEEAGETAERTALYSESIKTQTLENQITSSSLTATSPVLPNSNTDQSGDQSDTSTDLPAPPTDPTPPVVEIPDFTPEQPVEEITLKSRQLVWGRWGNTLPQNDTITVTYDEAIDGRNVTVGNTEFALYRTDTGQQRVDKGLGTVNFALNSAQATYTSAVTTEAMDISQGTLGINFTTNRFNTSLDLNSPSAGDVIFTASGQVKDGGYFNSRSATQRVGGAVSLDGQEAGYFFSQQLPGGNISGITLWDSQ